MEPKQGESAPTNKYDAAARELNKAGIQVLQVNGLTPSWAEKQKNRFPADLRDAYRFHREMARRWKGQVQAFEPWNEADWIQFGGHTGAEMASFQKACYWGLKAGNPDMIVCQNVFELLPGGHCRLPRQPAVALLRYAEFPSLLVTRWAAEVLCSVPRDFRRAADVGHGVQFHPRIVG